MIPGPWLGDSKTVVWFPYAGYTPLVYVYGKQADTYMAISAVKRTFVVFIYDTNNTNDVEFYVNAGVNGGKKSIPGFSVTDGILHTDDGMIDTAFPVDAKAVLRGLLSPINARGNAQVTLSRSTSNVTERPGLKVTMTIP